MDMERLSLTVTPEQDGRTVKSLMRRELAMAEGRISSVKFRPEGIVLNGQPAHTTARVHTGDVLSVLIADRGSNPAPPMAAEVPVLWEDEAFAIINKPAHISVYGGTRLNLASSFADKWGKDTEFHPVNRLDVGTTGLMVLAKDGYIHDRLRRMLHTDRFLREYEAVAQGAVSPPQGTIDLPISSEPVEGTRRAIDPEGLPSRTDYTVLRTSPDRSLLRLRLYTGRTHQIRVHMAATGHPLVGDERYGATDLALPRPALHSCHIRLLHPLTGEEIDIEAPMPEDMASLMR